MRYVSTVKTKKCIINKKNTKRKIKEIEYENFYKFMVVHIYISTHIPKDPKIKWVFDKVYKSEKRF